MNEAVNVKLQPPGHGLPLPELLIARAAFWLGRKFMTRARALELFETEAKMIRRLAESLPPHEAARPVLIPRIVGLEDSSRGWSVFMTLQHLIIVDGSIASILKNLSAGRSLDRPVSVAAVKPGFIEDPKVVQRFSDAAANYTRTLAEITSLRTQSKEAHPWFGSLDAHGWHCLAATHHSIHRRQIERIIQLLPMQSSRTPIEALNKSV